MGLSLLKKIIHWRCPSLGTFLIAHRATSTNWVSCCVGQHSGMRRLPQHRALGIRSIPWILSDTPWGFLRGKVSFWLHSPDDTPYPQPPPLPWESPPRPGSGSAVPNSPLSFRSESPSQQLLQKNLYVRPWCLLSTEQSHSEDFPSTSQIRIAKSVSERCD